MRDKLNPPRIVVIGISGAGKTTLARRLAARLGLPHLELDAVYWGPGWTEAAEPAMRQSLLALAEQPGWVADGNYFAEALPTLWTRATHLVWLDYPHRVVMPRVIRRSAWRLLGRATLWNGNRERWRNLLDPGHPVRYAWRMLLPRRAAIEAALASGLWSELEVIRLRHPAEAEGALDRLARSLSCRPR
ncbi:P-loop NTPase family protein [Teichococcus vastitatis]|uniref:AAA family ATPase n=1 Tax=Teichococcus vastitatis TaxID=2307076 RepID=A0ABS9W642_9PROT|nr:AAA family ATPase [Pseudoroseomonas vastitatis]MCI0754375.1 AAA family ATPase [Pseudoroseomonas vastitatis]